MKATKTMHVDAKPDHVLSYFLEDWTSTPPGMTMNVVHEGPEVVGNSYEWTFKMLGLPRKGVTVYTDYVPAERLAFRNFGALEGTSTWTVEPEDGGTKVTIHVESRLAVPFISRFFDPILHRAWEKHVAWAVRDLEEQTEVTAAA